MPRNWEMYNTAFASQVRYNFGMSQIVLLVVGALVGLLAGQGSEWLRLRREEKQAIGRALKTLLYVRDYLYSLKRTKEIIKEHANLPSQQIVQFQYFMQAVILPSARNLVGKYEEAIDVVSGFKPLLGLRLAKQTELVPTIMRIAQLVGQSEQASTAWLSLETHISDPSILDNLILDLAELHSIDMRYEVRRQLEEILSVPSDFENFFKENAKATQNSEPTQKQEI